MSSKRIIFLILLLMVGLAGQAFAQATLTPVPTTVPRGAYVNGPLGAFDDSYFWQEVVIDNIANGHAVAATITLTLPTGMTVADIDGDANLAEEITVSYLTPTNAVTLTPTSPAGTTIVLTIGGGAITAAENPITVSFPVVTTLTAADGDYFVTFSDGVGDNLADGSGPTITFVDPGPNALALVAYDTDLAGNDDTTLADGEIWPAVGDPIYTANTPDFLTDVDDTGANSTLTIGANLPADVATTFTGTAAADNTDDMFFRVYASTDSTLNFIDFNDTGVIQLDTYATGGVPVDYFNEGTTGVTGLAVSSLPVGDWYLYTVSSLTGNFSLGRSGKLTVTHWPQVDVLAWDFDANGTLESGAWPGDTQALTLDSGLFYAPEGTIIPAGGWPTTTDVVDLYISVDDFDDDATINLYYGAANLDTSDVVTSGSSPDLVVSELTGATLITSNLLENDEDDNGFIVYTWTIDSSIPAGGYTIYAVANDGKNQHVKPLMGLNTANPPTYSGPTALAMNVKHSPDLVLNALSEYDLGHDTNNDANVTIDPTQTDVIMLSWGKQGVNGDTDIDDSCTIEFYIDAAGALDVVDFGSDDADALRLAANTTPLATHQIVVDLVEDDETKAGSYYVWNLKDDWLSQGTPWEPADEAASSATGHYHMYAIISEGTGASDVERVVCLGINTIFAAGASTPTEISFDLKDGYASLVEPPVDGSTIGPNDTFRLNFDAFDFDDNADVGIFIVEESSGATMVTNGDFNLGDEGSWTLGAEWTIAAGQAVYTDAGGVTTLDQAFATEANINYTVSMDVVAITDGGSTLDVTLGGVAVASLANADAGTSINVTVVGAANAAGLVFTPAGAAFAAATIDNIVVKPGNGLYNDGMMVTTIGEISGGNLEGGDAYALPSDDGTLGAHVTYAWPSEDTDSTYDISLWIPGAGAARYTDDIQGVAAAPALADGNYYVYIGTDGNNNDFADGTEVLYRAPGLLTITGIGGGNPQQNLSMEPRKLVSTIGDSTTVSVYASMQVATDLIDVYVSVEQDYFELVDASAPFTIGGLGGATATIVANEAINDSTNGRWILHATLFNTGANIAPTTTGVGDELLTFQVVGKGTTNPVGEITAFEFLNEPINGYITALQNNGITLASNKTGVAVDVKPRGIIEGIVELQGRPSSSSIVTFILRDRGSYVATTDSAFIAKNDGAQADSAVYMDAALYAADGIQYRTDVDGKFTLYQVPTGEWELSVYYERYLAVVRDVTITAGLDSLMVDFGTLAGGDATGYIDASGDVYPNNAITQADVDRIIAAFGDTPDSSRWSTDIDPSTSGKYNYKWADIDEDDVVGVLDLTMATENFTGVDNIGAQPVYLKPAIELPAGGADAFVEFVNVPTEIKAGESYMVQVVINNAVNVRAYDLRMSYDPYSLSFENIEKGDFVKDNSVSFSMSNAGSFGLVNSVYGTYSYSGDGILAEVTFKANKDGVFSSDMLGISQAMVVDANYVSFDLMGMDAPTGITSDAPVAFALNQNFPNPFNPTTTISFSIPRSSNVEIKIYNVLGRHVSTLASGMYEPGNYSIVWDATDMSGNLVSNGMYFCTINAADYHSTTKMMFMK